MTRRQGPRGVTMVELLVAAVLASLLMVMVYGAFHLMFASRGRHSITALTHRSFLQKDKKAGLRRLVYRLREAIQILSPLPGRSAPELLVRDVTNTLIRIRRDPGSNMVLSEVNRGGQWTEELTPTTVDVGGTRVAASWPVRMHSCVSLTFTAIGPDCVAIRAGLEEESQEGGFMTVIKLRNSSVAY